MLLEIAFDKAKKEVMSVLESIAIKIQYAVWENIMKNSSQM